MSELTETAFVLGYSDLSHFTQAFRRGRRCRRANSSARAGQSDAAD